MKMKKRFGFVMIMAAMVVAAYDDVQVVYRGQLKANGQAPAAQTMPMTFRLYAKKNSGTASWTTNGVVAIDDKGLFQVALRGEGLAEAIDSGKANWIGISIAGGKEHYPRHRPRRRRSRPEASRTRRPSAPHPSSESRRTRSR